MTDVLGSVWWLLVSLGILVTFHEYGHFWVARRCGVKVLCFSIGFGPKLIAYTARDGTQYQLALIPLGGYVKMLGERGEDGDPDPGEHGQALNHKPVWQKMAITAAGPFANLVLCFALLWLMFVIGRPDYAPIVGQTTAIAAETALHRGDRITRVNTTPTATWSELQLALLPAALDRRDAQLQVVDGQGHERSVTLPLSQLPENFDQRRTLPLIGLWPEYLSVPPIVGRVLDGSPAAAVLAEGDIITAIDGHRVETFSDIGPRVQALGEENMEAMLEIERDGQRLALPFRPARQVLEDGSARWVLGIEPPQNLPLPERDALQHYGPVAAVPAALAEIGQQTGQIFGMLGRAFSGRIALENTIAGPITIARITHAYASQGLAWYLSILAMLSLSLAILNLLPIPILDGGHLVYYSIEWIKGSPLSERALAAGHYVGLALLVALMGLAFHNDIFNLIN